MRQILLLTFLFVCLQVYPQDEIHGRSVRVADGDTFTLLDDNNVQHRIRLEGIDAPEQGQAFGNRSREYLSNLIVGKRLKATYKEKDRYGRILGKVSTDSIKDINLEMIKAGMAWHYSYYNKEEEYAEVHEQAKKSRAGLWIDKNPINPYEWRKGKR
ncbi:thermonuclease family protein [Proteiniphilum saccharofermentans]|uniref:thermonuclease family protein n=1 Tax=Proteiniphilum saccharofermentans TaxID=1642647 RepID=UPI0028A6825E|nr:thermonuclease family protein [Proteiniphilum saccharofermentans]